MIHLVGWTKTACGEDSRSDSMKARTVDPRCCRLRANYCVVHRSKLFFLRFLFQILLLKTCLAGFQISHSITIGLLVSIQESTFPGHCLSFLRDAF